MPTWQRNHHYFGWPTDTNGACSGLALTVGLPGIVSAFPSATGRDPTWGICAGCDIAWRLGRQGAYRGDQILTALCHSQGCRNIPWFCTHMRLYVTGQWCSCDKHVLVWTDLSALLEPTVRLKPKVPTHDKLLPASCSDWGSCLCKICSLRAYDHSCNIPFVF